MKKIHLVFLLLLSVTLVSCDGDGDGDDNAPAPVIPDTVAPQVTINSPEANEPILVIDWINVLAKVTDDKRLDTVRVVMAEPNGARKILSEDAVTRNPLREYELSRLYQIPKNAAIGDYTVMVEAKDKGGNVARDSVTFALHASDINNAAFAKSFESSLLSYFAATLDWYGYNYWDMGYAFDNRWFNFTMFLMVNTDNEFSVSEAKWNRFITDFDVKNQSWAEWDENSDGNLSDAEFFKGLSSLNLFKDWDQNQNELVSYEEMANGFFDRWDTNEDNLLSREECLEKFYTYLYRE